MCFVVFVQSVSFVYFGSRLLLVNVFSVQVVLFLFINNGSRLPEGGRSWLSTFPVPCLPFLKFLLRIEFSIF